MRPPDRHRRVTNMGPQRRKVRLPFRPGFAALLLATVLTLATVYGAAGPTAPPQITPFGIMYAIHDALVRPLPGQKVGNSLAESWTESPDGLVYEFKLRRGVKFHNDYPVTAEDAKI